MIFPPISSSIPLTFALPDEKSSGESEKSSSVAVLSSSELSAPVSSCVSSSSASISAKSSSEESSSTISSCASASSMLSNAISAKFSLADTGNDIQPEIRTVLNITAVNLFFIIFPHLSKFTLLKCNFCQVRKLNLFFFFSPIKVTVAYYNIALVIICTR